MRATPFLVLPLVLAGCVQLERAPPVPLVEYFGESSHFHDGVRSVGHHVQPLSRIGAPWTCRAMRDNVTFVSDRCEVVGSKDPMSREPAAWHLVATYAIREEERQDFHADVSAYDGHGHIVAFWDGRRSAEFVLATE